MTIERNVAVPMRDGVTIYMDLYRPAGVQGGLPLLVAWSPYGKHGGVTLDHLPGHDVNPEHLTRHYHFEAADPPYWCAHGYAVAFVDPRGTWGSEGEHTLFAYSEAEDGYDLIEWCADQAWCSGKVGLIGQSYFSMVQWKIASLNPPHLACIAPWGAASDVVADTGVHNGIPETVFWENFRVLAHYSKGAEVEDLRAGFALHPFRDAFWEDKCARLSDVTVPAYIVADWTDIFFHSDGTINGYLEISSERKWLEINGRKKWERFVQPEHVERLRMFYDTFLQDKDRGIEAWAPIRLEVRDAFKQGRMYEEHEWPLARTDYRSLYLHAGGQARFEPAEPGVLSYPAEGGVHFDFAVTETMELTGYMKLHLWVEADGSDDMDLFVGVRRIDGNGKVVNFPWLTIHDNGEAALGCLRVSHRHQDPAKTTPQRVVLTHDREQRLSPGQVVEVDVPIYPSSTQFQPGDTLRIMLQGHDIVTAEHDRPGVVGHTDLRNRGRHIVRLGGDHQSFLQIPVIPPRDEQSEALS
jgi:predicted acyl esterase